MKTQLAPTESFIFRRTAAQKGRHLAVTPENSSMRHLSYGRIVLDGGTQAVKFQTGPRATGLMTRSSRPTAPFRASGAFRQTSVS